MPPEPAAAPAPVVNTPGVAPAAVTPPPEAAPKPERPKSFTERWQALEEAGAIDGSDDAEQGKPDGKAKPKPAAPEGETAPTVAERAEFRAYKARTEADLMRREQAVKSAEAAVGTSDRVKKADALLAALENGDPDAFASAAGHKDWNELNDAFIRRLADPNYRELAEMKRELAERKQREEDAAKSELTAAEQRKSAELRHQYMNSLHEKAKASTDPLAAAMATDGMFLNTVFQIHQEAWQRDGSTLTLEQALDNPVGGGKLTLRDELRSIYDRLHKGFGGASAAPAATTAAAGEPATPPKNGKKPAPRTGVTPAKTTDAAGGKGKWEDPKKWREYATQRLAEADD